MKVEIRFTTSPEGTIEEAVAEIVHASDKIRQHLPYMAGRIAAGSEFERAAIVDANGNTVGRIKITNFEGDE